MYVVVMTSQYRPGTEEKRRELNPVFRQALLNAKGLQKFVAGSTGNPDAGTNVSMWDSAADLKALRESAENRQMLSEIWKLRAVESTAQEFEVTFEV